ncbi:M24 family metallopeptidase [Actinomyces sp. B33]|uniref:type I methionyl aminopeptidase n=1 Tax=Actinomyces sp. B33 TaxID=2942131 RepID=UPI002340C585|nr:M24 family metallopeptidase [Actinomyces sp. B33]MDC4232128.1 M24 family metallopeptidase [Actinomyces sp. B33]
MSRIEIKSRRQIGWMREAGLVVADIHKSLRSAARPGVTTAELDAVSAEAIARAGATSNFLHYYGYPATVCISVNDVVVHGIPDDRVLAEGDLVSFDCGAWVGHDSRQWHGDAAFSMIVGREWIGDADFAAGARSADRVPADADPAVRRRHELDDVTRESLWAALAALATGRRVSAVGRAVEEVVAERAEALGWEAGIIEEYTGHGIGTAMHQAPDVLNFNARGISPKLRPGMVLAVEPMLVAGSIETSTDADEWTVRTVDGADAAHWEHSIALLDDGVCVLTAPDCGAAGLAPYGVAPVVL